MEIERARASERGGVGYLARRVTLRMIRYDRSYVLSYNNKSGCKKDWPAPRSLAAWTDRQTDQDEKKSVGPYLVRDRDYRIVRRRGAPKTAADLSGGRPTIYYKHKTCQNSKHTPRESARCVEACSTQRHSVYIVMGVSVHFEKV